MNPKEKFGKLLKDIMQEKRISQRMLAKALGVKQPYISRITQGKAALNKNQFFKLCNYFKLEKNQKEELKDYFNSSRGIIEVEGQIPLSLTLDQIKKIQAGEMSIPLPQKEIKEMAYKLIEKFENANNHLSEQELEKEFEKLNKALSEKNINFYTNAIIKSLDSLTDREKLRILDLVEQIKEERELTQSHKN